MYELGTIIEEAIQYVESGMKTNALDKLSQASMLAEGAGSESAALKRALAEQVKENERLRAEQEAVAVEFADWLTDRATAEQKAMPTADAFAAFRESEAGKRAMNEPTGGSDEQRK